MCKYVKKIGNGVELEIEINYELGNSWTRVKRGYYIQFNKFYVVEFSNGAVSRQFTPLSDDNMTIFIEPTKRYSKKRFGELCSILENNKDKLMDSYQKFLSNKGFDFKMLRELFGIKEGE